MYTVIASVVRNLGWARLSGPELQSVMILSGFAAREFAESFRIALRLHQTSVNLKNVASEEIRTGNLQFEDYSEPGDHADFLWHFIGREELARVCPRETMEAGARYLSAVWTLPPEVRAMSIFSRERELPGIFSQVLRAKDWSALGLPAYRYYLKRHIYLDSREGGHAELLAGFPVDESVAAFWEARLDMYRCIPTLFR